MAIVGIDLGTTTSEVAYIKGKESVIIPNLEEGNSTIIPSVVFIDKDNIKVGHKAKNQAILKPKNTISEIKRLMGSDEKIIVTSKEYAPIEISALIIKKLKEVAEFYIGEEVTEAVITVPANFNETERRATKKAGELAGLKVDRIINEPTAAAIAYGINNLENEEIILVYDLGGGTFDVSILELSQKVLDVKCSRGNNKLGGKDIDDKLINLIIEEFYKDSGIRLNRNDKRILSTLKRLAEDAKIDLSTEKEVEVICPYIATKNSMPIDLNITISVDKFNDLIKDIVKETEKVIDEALLASKLKVQEIDKVIAVGGSTRIPYIRHMLKRKFNNKLISGVNPEETIAIGAAIQASIKNGIEKELIITDAVSHTLGVEVIGNKFDPIIKRDSKLPIEVTNGYITTDDNQELVNIRIYEGENEEVKLNTFISEFELKGLPPKKKGEEKVAITFKYDLNGILDVSAEIISIGKSVNKKIDMGKGSETILTVRRKEKEEKNDVDIKKSKNVNEEVSNEVNDINVTVNGVINEAVIESVEVDSKDRGNRQAGKENDKEVKNNNIDESGKEELILNDVDNKENDYEVNEDRDEVDIGTQNNIEEVIEESRNNELIEEEDEEVELTEAGVYSDTVNLTNYVNSRMEYYEPDLQREIRDKLGDLLVLIRSNDLRGARDIQLHIISILPKEEDDEAEEVTGTESIKEEDETNEGDS